MLARAEQRVFHAFESSRFMGKIDRAALRKNIEKAVFGGDVNRRGFGLLRDVHCLPNRPFAGRRVRGMRAVQNFNRFLKLRAFFLIVGRLRKLFQARPAPELFAPQPAQPVFAHFDHSVFHGRRVFGIADERHFKLFHAALRHEFIHTIRLRGFSALPHDDLGVLLFEIEAAAETQPRLHDFRLARGGCDADFLGIVHVEIFDVVADFAGRREQKRADFAFHAAFIDLRFRKLIRAFRPFDFRAAGNVQHVRGAKQDIPLREILAFGEIIFRQQKDEDERRHHHGQSNRHEFRMALQPAADGIASFAQCAGDFVAPSGVFRRISGRRKVFFFNSFEQIILFV